MAPHRARDGNRQNGRRGQRERPGQGARNSRNEVTQDDDVEPEGAGRGLTDRDGAVQLFVRQSLHA